MCGEFVKGARMRAHVDQQWAELVSIFAGRDPEAVCGFSGRIAGSINVCDGGERPTFERWSLEELRSCLIFAAVGLKEVVCQINARRAA